MKPLRILWQNLTRPDPSISGIDERRQSQLLASLLIGIIVPAIAALIHRLTSDGPTARFFYSSGAVLTLFVIYYINRIGRYRISSYIIVGYIFVVTFGLSAFVDTIYFMFFACMTVIMAAMLVPRLAIPTFIVGLATNLIASNFFPVNNTVDNYSPTVLFAVIGASILVFMNHRTNLDKEHQEELRTANDALKRSESELERRVLARTRDLELASYVARQITTVLDLDELLPQLVDQTKAAFDLYFVSIYLYQPETDRLVLSAGTDEAGRKMLHEEVGFSLEARPSLVAKAARDRQSVVINDVSQSEAHAENPYLPDTQSEAVFPMYVGDELIGVLGTQSKMSDRFGRDDVEIFGTMAEQIAIAVKNAQLYENQKQLAEGLRSADQMKSQFLASMSHELRTPLNAIINFSEMIAMEMIGPVNEDQKGLLNQSLESSQHLLNLINDVLDVSKIQAGELKLFVEDDVNLHAELKTVVGMVEPLINDKSVKFIKDIDDDLPIMTADKRRIRQIALNLLANAAKFTDEGSITLSVKKQGDHVLLVVADTGPGITEEMQNFIFEPFLQTEDGIKHAEGTGLGLPIARSLVMAHGGELWLESQPGEGATFYVKLPINSATSAASPVAVPAAATQPVAAQVQKNGRANDR